jgi:hypothetical protein
MNTVRFELNLNTNKSFLFQFFTDTHFFKCLNKDESGSFYDFKNGTILLSDNCIIVVIKRDDTYTKSFFLDEIKDFNFAFERVQNGKNNIV